MLVPKKISITQVQPDETTNVVSISDHKNPWKFRVEVFYWTNSCRNIDFEIAGPTQEEAFEKAYRMYKVATGELESWDGTHHDY